MNNVKTKVLEGQLQIDLTENTKVTMRNDFASGKYDLSALEQKLVLINIASIKFEDEHFNANTFRVIDMAQLLNVTPEMLYRDLKRACDSLTNKKIYIQKEDGSWEFLVLVPTAKYIAKTGTVLMRLNEDAKPYLLQLRDMFTSFELSNILNLKSKYSIRIYQLMKSHSYRKELIITLDDLKYRLSLDDKKQKSYRLFSNVSERVLKPAMREINDKTDITIDYEAIKQGRKIYALRFKIKDKQKVIINPKEISNGKKQQSKQSKRKDNKFFNFPEREYDYDYLEKVLTGEEEYDGRPYSKY